MFDYSEARKYTKENIGGKKGKIVGYAILYAIFNGILSSILGSFNGLFGFMAPVIIAAVLTPLNVGFFRMMTNFVNNKEVKFSMFFDDYKYFVNLFVIGLACNFVIALGNKIFIGWLLSLIYAGILYFFIYNSNLSIGDLFSKSLKRVKDYLGGIIILALSYVWPIIVATVVYLIIAVIIITITAAFGIKTLIALTSVEDLLPLLSATIPFALITIIFSIIIIILAFIIIPKYLFAEARFFSAFNESKEEVKEAKVEKTGNAENGANFCSNCGSKVTGKFCTNCGSKIKE